MSLVWNVIRRCANAKRQKIGHRKHDQKICMDGSGGFLYGKDLFYLALLFRGLSTQTCLLCSRSRQMPLKTDRQTPARKTPEFIGRMAYIKVPSLKFIAHSRSRSQSHSRGFPYPSAPAAPPTAAPLPPFHLRLGSSFEVCTRRLLL